MKHSTLNILIALTLFCLGAVVSNISVKWTLTSLAIVAGIAAVVRQTRGE
jgi:hypothetical protein